MDVWNFILDHGSQFWSNGATHARLVGTALVLAVPVAVAVGVLASSRPRLAGVALAVAGVIITIPSFALFGLLIAPLGLGFRPAVATLALYALLPVLRNTIVGLAEVPADVVEAARGMGMTGRQALWRVRLPLALPVIIAGGLGPENVQDAIHVAHPAGVDSKTKTDTSNGTHTKDLQKVSAFVAAARSANSRTT